MSVFLSYRREDSAGYAGRLCDHLGAAFGEDQVFMDVQDIAPGQDFPQAIEHSIEGCQAVVVVIGPRWVEELKKRAGGEDFVRREVSAALSRDITVIPVLVGGARMPVAADLPEDLARLCSREALVVSDDRFNEDARLLAQALVRTRGFSSGHRFRRPWVWVLVAALLAATGGAVIWKERRAPEVAGVWVAEMQSRNQRPYRVRLRLVVSRGAVTGSVAYPSGEATIEEGTLRNGRLAFVTVHTPQFELAAGHDSLDGGCGARSDPAQGHQRKRRSDGRGPPPAVTAGIE